MTLRTATYDTATHKLVPLEPDHAMVSAALCGRMMPQSCDVIARIRQQMKSDLAAAIAAAPEYKEPEQLCDDGGKCGAGGYCSNCTAPVVKENEKLRERLANQHAKIEQLRASLQDTKIAKQAERYEKVRKLDARQFAEIFRMNIQEGIPFDELIDGICIFTALDIAEAEKEGEKMWQALCEDDGGKCGAGGYCKDCIQDTKKDE